jgi:hypothetical protein
MNTRSAGVGIGIGCGDSSGDEDIVARSLAEAAGQSKSVQICAGQFYDDEGYVGVSAKSREMGTDYDPPTRYDVD